VSLLSFWGKNAGKVLNIVLACMRMAERAYELECVIFDICRGLEVELAPAMVRSITQFSESINRFSKFGIPSAHTIPSTLKKIHMLVRNQVEGGSLRRIFRSMKDADLIKECNAELKHALDVFGVRLSSLICHHC
jgi:hypothetical protein